MGVNHRGLPVFVDQCLLPHFQTPNNNGTIVQAEGVRVFDHSQPLSWLAQFCRLVSRRLLRRLFSPPVDSS